MKRFMLGCRFSFKAYAKKVKEEATKCSLKFTKVLLDADVRNIARYPKFDIYQGTRALDFFSKRKFFLNFAMSYIRSFLADTLSGF